MESLVKLIPYSQYHKYLLVYQLIATVLACMPVFLSFFFLFGLPHFLFVLLIGFLAGGRPGLARRVFHGLMFLYYAALLLLTLELWPEIIGHWMYADTIDKLIRIQMMLLPLILTIQLGFIAFEWTYPILKPHEFLEQQAARQRKKSKIQSI